MLSQGKLCVIKMNTSVITTCFYMSYYERGGKETTKTSKSSCTILAGFPNIPVEGKGTSQDLFFGAFASSNK